MWLKPNKFADDAMGMVERSGIVVDEGRPPGKLRPCDVIKVGECADLGLSFAEQFRELMLEAGIRDAMINHGRPWMKDDAYRLTMYAQCRCWNQHGPSLAKVMSTMPKQRTEGVVRKGNICGER